MRQIKILFLLTVLFIIIISQTVRSVAGDVGNGEGGKEHFYARLTNEIQSVKQNLLFYIANANPEDYENPRASEAFYNLVNSGIVKDLNDHGPYEIANQCLDKNDEDKLATAVIGDRTKRICWSKKEFLKEMKKSNISLEELVLGTAIHEHAHRLGYPEEVAYNWGSLLGKEAFFFITKSKLGWLNNANTFSLSNELTRNIVASLNSPKSRGGNAIAVKLRGYKALYFGITFGVSTNIEFWNESARKELRAAENVMADAINEVYDKCTSEKNGVIQGIYLENHVCSESSASGDSKWYCVAEVYGKCTYLKGSLSGYRNIFSYFDSEWTQVDSVKAENFKKQFLSGYKYNSFFKIVD